MQKISMLGSGFIGRFYTDSLHGYRNKDRVVSIYSRREESAKKFAEDFLKVHEWINDKSEKFPHIFADHVSGNMKSAERNNRIPVTINIIPTRSKLF